MEVLCVRYTYSTKKYFVLSIIINEFFNTLSLPKQILKPPLSTINKIQLKANETIHLKKIRDLYSLKNK